MRMRNMKRGFSALLAIVMLLASFSVVIAESVELMAVAEPVITFNQKVVSGAVKVEVQITCATSGARIFYTTNGSTPSTSSTRYNDSNRPVFDESQNITITARAYPASGSTGYATAKKNKLGFRITASKSYEGKNNEYVRITFNGLKNGETLRYTVDGSNPTESSAALPSTNKLPLIDRNTDIKYRVYYSNYEPTYIHMVQVRENGWLDTVEAPARETELIYGGKRIILSTNTEGATIYYKVAKGNLTDKDYPSIESNVTAVDAAYTAPLEFTEAGKYTIKTFAAKAGMANSYQKVGCFDVEVCSTPEITVSSASGGRKRVTITAGSGEAIYFTRDGSQPTRGSEGYTGPFYVGENCTIKAVAVRQGYANSSVRSMAVTGASGGSVYSPALQGAVNSPVGARAIYLATATEGAAIYYNISSSGTAATPSASNKGTLYTGPIEFKQNGTYSINAVTVKDGLYSNPYRASVPVTIVSGGNFLKTLPNGIRTITFEPVSNAEIYYVLKSGRQNYLTAEEIDKIEANRYVYPITISEESSLSAVSINSDGLRSPVYNATITVAAGTKAPEKVAEPTVRYTSGGVVIECSDAEADIFYVLDNSPDTVATAAGIAYESGTVINVTGNTYIHAVAMKPGFTPSAVTANTVQQGNKTATPVISIIKAGTNSYSGTITCSTPGARIYYTVNGDEPTTASKEYSGYISEPLTSISVVKAIAVAPGLLPSDVAVKLVVGDKPDDVKIEDKDVYGGKGVKLESPTIGAYIYYTLDGTTPSAGSGKFYTGEEILINTPGTVILKAVATLPGYADSDVTTKTYTLTKLQKPSVGKANYGNYKAVQMNYPGTETDVEIVYTTDGSAPGPDSTRYVPDNRINAILFSESVARLRIAAIKKGYVSSDEFLTSVEVEPSVEVPVEDKNSSQYILGGRGVALECATEDAQIYYTYEPKGTPNIPYEKGTLIPLTSPNQIIRAMAVKAGMLNSGVMEFSFSDMAVAASPTASLENNSLVNVGDKVELISGSYVVPGTSLEQPYTVFYTTDGTEPTLESERYTGPITINGETEIRAAAAGIGHALSPTAIFYYRMEDEATGVEINTSGLKNDGGLLYGAVKVSGADKLADGGRAIVALYSGDRMLTAVEQELSGNMTFDIDENSGIMADDGSITVKLFVFDSLESLVPKCKAEKRIY